MHSLGNRHSFNLTKKVKKCVRFVCKPTNELIMASEQKYETLKVEVNDGVGYITFTRPREMNSFVAAQYADVRAALSFLDAHEDVRVAVITGSGR